MHKPFILGIGGTLRHGSTSEKALWVSLRAAERHGATVAALTGEELNLPMYAPGSAMQTAEAARLVALMRDCDGVIVSSPSYHGGISGIVKNALDYTEEMRGDERPYLDGIAFGCIVCAAGWQGVGVTLTALRSIAHALRAWPTPLGAGINALTNPFDPAGNCTDQGAAAQLALVGRQVVDFATANRPAHAAVNGSGEAEHLKLAAS